MNEFYERSDVIRILNLRIEDFGGVKEFCNEHGLTESQIRIAREHQNLPAEVLRALGLRSVIAYERV